MNVNEVIKKAYFSLLGGNGYQVFAHMAPDNMIGNYIVYKPISAAQSIKTAKSVTVQMQISIVSERLQYNSGEDIDDIASFIYGIIYPNPNHVLVLDAGFKMIYTTLSSDNTNDYSLKDAYILIERVITFEHNIYIN